MRRTEDGAGVGGWPTIRYFNKETGLGGGTYKKKTSEAMCKELGDEARMIDYIEEYSHASLCTVIDGKGCNEKEMTYADKMKDTSVKELEGKLVRLEGMRDVKVKAELKTWIIQRMKILRQLLKEREESASTAEL